MGHANFLNILDVVFSWGQYHVITSFWPSAEYTIEYNFILKAFYFFALACGNISSWIHVIYLLISLKVASLALDNN